MVGKAEVVEIVGKVDMERIVDNADIWNSRQTWRFK
jgi:hypothetical protein